MTKDEKKELIDLAAKAAGIDNKKFTGWNPVDDDADALKLAIKLNLFIDASNLGFTLAGWQVNQNSGFYKDVQVFHGDDSFAATRLAITEAAAEIGKTK